MSFSFWRELSRMKECSLEGKKKNLCDSSFQCKIWEDLILKWYGFFFTEQVLLDQNVQTPPPSPFSIQAFSKGTSCSNGQGFDYGLGNNKGMFFSIIFFKMTIILILLMFLSLILYSSSLQKKKSVAEWIVRCFFSTSISLSLSTLYKKHHQMLERYRQLRLSVMPGTAL